MLSAMHRSGVERDTLLAAARTLLLDRCAVEAVAALDASGVRTIVLKGPAVAGWLYGDGTFRGYKDCDLLVSPADLPAAGAVLSRLGYRTYRRIRGDRPSAGQPWRRDPEGAVIDLHHSLWGIAARPDEAWQMLSVRTERLALAGATVEILSAPARTLNLSLHAVAHRGAGVPLEDLRRGLDLVAEPTWREAAGLAARLGATAPFAAGLWLLPAGRALAARLELPEVSTVEVEIRLLGAPSTSLGWWWFRRQPGIGAKAGYLLRKLVPPPSYMPLWWPPAGRGKGWLALAYAGRPFWLVLHAPRALASLRAAERAAAKGADTSPAGGVPGSVRS